MTLRTLTHMTLMASLLAACGPDSGDPATRYADRGDRAVGYRVLDADGLVVKAWYPAEIDADAAITYDVPVKFPGFDGAPMPFEGNAVMDAPVLDRGGPHPLVVLSHGFAMNPEWYAPTAEHLASHGFVVLGPEHTEADWAMDVVTSTAVRPSEVSATIDLAASGALDGLVDVEHVAVMGHSYGGYTALAVAGARIDLQALETRCEDVQEPFIQGFFCGPFLEQDALAGAFGLDATPTGMFPSMRDDRVDAIVPFAGDAYLFGDGLAEVTVPALVMGGTADTGTPWTWGPAITFEGIESPDRVLVGFEGGEHFLPVADCADLPWIDALPAEMRAYFCEDPAWEKSEALRLTNHLTTAFLREHLLGKKGAGNALDPEAYEVDGLTLERFE